MQTQDLIALIKEKYSVKPDYPWDALAEYSVFRHSVSRKWFGVLMRIPRLRLGQESAEMIDVLNVKVDPKLIYDIRRERGIYTAYHMNKQHWVTIALCEAEAIVVEKLVEMSYELTRTRKDLV